MNELTFQGRRNLIGRDSGLTGSVRQFCSVERFFQITSVAASVNIALLFLLLIVLTNPEWSQHFMNISF